MKIIVSNLVDGEHKYVFKENVDFFDIDDVKTNGDIVINVLLNKMYRQLHLKINIEGEFIFPCDRCLDDFSMKLKNEFEAVYKMNKEDFDADESQDDNIFYISPEVNYIDIKDIVRDYILLAIPMRKVPEEKDGICLCCNKKIEDILKVEIKPEVNPVWNKLINKN